MDFDPNNQYVKNFMEQRRTLFLLPIFLESCSSLQQNPVLNDQGTAPALGMPRAGVWLGGGIAHGQFCDLAVERRSASHKFLSACSQICFLPPRAGCQGTSRSHWLLSFIRFDWFELWTGLCLVKNATHALPQDIALFTKECVLEQFRLILDPNCCMSSQGTIWVQ